MTTPSHTRLETRGSPERTGRRAVTLVGLSLTGIVLRALDRVAWNGQVAATP